MNFGPIKRGNIENDGWVDISKVTVFIGNQGSGKSTLAKLISTFAWMEKALVRGDFKIRELERKNKLKSVFLPYHRIQNYLREDTIIEYRGDAYNIIYRHDFLHIEELLKQQYSLPQIMYVPAERNFLSYLKKASEIKLSSKALQEFLGEFENSKKDIKNAVPLPINNTQLEYHKLTDTLYVKGSDYRISLGEASSGYQSLAPLYLVSNYLANSVKGSAVESQELMSGNEIERFRKGISEILQNDSLTPEQRRIAISELSRKFNKSAFINIVEEPEQNLFPISQGNILYALLKANSKNRGNKLVITTHSPYIINYISLAIQAGHLKDKIQDSNDVLSKIDQVVPIDAVLDKNDVLIYQMDDVSGTISRLLDYEGIPSDDNYLNKNLRAGNELFDKLLEIEEEYNA